MSATKMSPDSLPTCNTWPRNIPGKTFLPMQSPQVFSRKRVIFDHCTKRYYWSVKWYSESPLTRYLLIRQEILYVAQIEVTFDGIRPPFFIQTRLQQYCRCPVFHSAHRPLSNPICFRSARCCRANIPGQVFTKFAIFWRIVSIIDFWFPRRLQELSQGSSGSPEKFLLYTGMIVSTELPSLVPLQRIDDCVEIHTVH